MARPSIHGASNYTRTSVLGKTGNTHTGTRFEIVEGWRGGGHEAEGGKTDNSLKNPMERRDRGGRGSHQMDPEEAGR